MDDQELMTEMLRNTKTIAVVGLSDKPERSSYHVTEAMQRAHYKIIPVNPRLTSWNGVPAFPSVSAIPASVDLVNVFRRSDEVISVVEDTIQKGGVRYLWMQQGIINEDAKALAERHGIKVVMDACIMVAYRLYGNANRSTP